MKQLPNWNISIVLFRFYAPGTTVCKNIFTQQSRLLEYRAADGLS